PLFADILALLRSCRLVLAGLAVVGAGAVFKYASLPAVGFLLMAAGLLVCAVAVQRRLRSAGWNLQDRILSAQQVGIAGLAAVLAALSLAKGWDSVQMVLSVGFLAALVGAVLIVLPSVARKVALSLILLFHFGGMLVAVTCVDPPGAVGPWVSKQLWTRVY